jgi:hypothetical protein
MGGACRMDRRFYRSKYDAERTLEAFAESLRDEVDVEHLEAALVGVIEEIMQPEHVSVWTNLPSGKTIQGNRTKTTL